MDLIEAFGGEQGSGLFAEIYEDDPRVVKILPLFNADDYLLQYHEKSGSAYQCALVPYMDVANCDSTVASSPLYCPGTNQAALFVLFFTHAFLAIFISLGNFGIILVISMNRSFHNPLNMFKLSLAIADLVVGVFVLPVACVMAIQIMFRPFDDSTEDFLVIDSTKSYEYNVTVIKKLIGDNVCKRIMTIDFEYDFSFYVALISILSVMASIYHLVLLSMDRFLAVKYPIKYTQGRCITNGKAAAMIGVSWMICIGAGIIYPIAGYRFLAHGMSPALLSNMEVVHPEMGLIYSLLAFVLPYILMLVLTVATAVILVRKWISNRKTFGGHGQRMMRNPGQTPRMQTEIRAALTLMIMVLIFSMTTLPSLIGFGNSMVDVATNSFERNEQYQILYMVMLILLILNSACNFIIYSFRSKDFRRALQNLIGRNRKRFKNTISSWKSRTWRRDTRRKRSSKRSTQTNNTFENPNMDPCQDKNDNSFKSYQGDSIPCHVIANNNV